MSGSPLTPLSPAEEKIQIAETLQEGWVHRCLIAFDQMCNVVFFDGLPDETISAHSARESLTNIFWAVTLSCWLNDIQKDHGADAVAGDLARAEVVEKVEESSGLLEK